MQTFGEPSGDLCGEPARRGENISDGPGENISDRLRAITGASTCQMRSRRRQVEGVHFWLLRPLAFLRGEAIFIVLTTTSIIFNTNFMILKCKLAPSGRGTRGDSSS